LSRYEIVTEVTGSVWQIVASIGDRLAEGAPVMIIESMKMEIPVLVEDEATLIEIVVEEGEPVSEGQVVAVVEG
jgi:acetyl-CoA carboxylase biotin carboxyl carrier protein